MKYIHYLAFTLMFASLSHAMESPDDLKLNSYIEKNKSMELLHIIGHLFHQNINCLDKKISEALQKENKSFCDIIDEEDNNATILHQLAQNYRYDYFINVARLIIKVAGKDAWDLISQRNYYGNTAFHQAIFAGNTALVKLLLEEAELCEPGNARALIYIKGWGDRTAEDMAHEFFSEKMLPLLQPYLK